MRSTTLVAGLAASLVVAGLVAGSRPAGAGEIILGFSAIVGNQSASWVAYESKSFEQQGLKVRLVYIQSGAVSSAAMLAGEAEFVLQSGPAVALSNLGGADIVMILGVTDRFIYQIYGAKGIRRLEELKGKIVAVQRIGADMSYIGPRYALRHAGLDPDRDVVYRAIGAQGARLAALQTGQVHATALAPPVNLQARKLGLPLLVDMIPLKIEYFMNGVAARKSYVEAHPELTLRFVKGFAAGIHFYKTRKEASLEIMGKYMRIRDQEILEEAYRIYAQELLARKPYPSTKAMQAVLDDLAQSDPRARTARAEELVHDRFVREADRSGFLDALYQPSSR